MTSACKAVQFDVRSPVEKVTKLYLALAYLIARHLKKKLEGRKALLSSGAMRTKSPFKLRMTSE